MFSNEKSSSNTVHFNATYENIIMITFLRDHFQLFFKKKKKAIAEVDLLKCGEAHAKT